MRSATSSSSLALSRSNFLRLSFTMSTIRSKRSPSSINSVIPSFSSCGFTKRNRPPLPKVSTASIKVFTDRVMVRFIREPIRNVRMTAISRKKPDVSADAIMFRSRTFSG